MSTAAVATILAGVAAKVGAPIVKSLLEKYVGGTGAEIGGVVIDAIAGRAGVTPEELPSVPQKELEAAVKQVEQVAPELVLAQVEQQKEANRLMMREMETGPFWSWAWRPAMMYLLGFFWVWSLVLVPLVNTVARSEVPVYLTELTFLTTAYLALYMGGHTIKAVRGA